MVKIGKYNYEKATAKNKKLSVIVDGKKINFGHTSYQHFKDKTGIWKSLNHGDKERRKNYLTRSKGIKDKNGNLTWKNKNTPNYWAVHFLWNG